MMEGFYVDCPSGGSYQDWWDHLAFQANNLAINGFTAIWLPCALKGATGGYSSGYDPFDDYDLGDKNQMGTIPTHYGTRQQLENCCATLHANGIQVYEDIVDSHRDGGNNYNYSYINYYGTANSGRFGKSINDFYTFGNGGAPMDYSGDVIDTKTNPDGNWIMPTTGGQTLINGTEWVWSAYGMDQSGAWITNALDLNGYRIDDAQATPWNWLYSFLNQPTMSNKFAVSEDYDTSVSNLSYYVGSAMNNRCSCFDFPLKLNYLNPMCNTPSSFNMASLYNAGFVAANPGGAVTFVENHDTDVNGSAIKQNKLLAYCYILTNQGYPCVYYRDWSTDSGSYGAGLQGGIRNLMWIHNFIANGGTTQRWENNSIYCFERTGGSHLLVGMNTASYPQTITCQTGFGANWELHDYTGHEPDVYTNGSGQVTITIPPLNGGTGYCCYSVENIGGSFTAPQYSTTQEYDGAIDLDLPPADNTQQVPVCTITPASGTSISGALTFDTAGWTTSTYITLQLLNSANTVVATKNYYYNTAQGTTLGISSANGNNYTYKIESFKTPTSLPKPDYALRITYTAPQAG
jgi:alpha-amylase